MKLKLSRVNTLLFVAILVINGYIIFAPIIPVLTFWVEKHTSNRFSQLTNQLTIPAGSVQAVPQDNRLVIPAMLLSVPVNEGRDASALRTGPWRRPNGSTPDKGGNTIIAAHRFTYTNPKGTFYFLNKVAVGDEIGVFWHGTRYLYRVSETKVVPPTDTVIEAPTTDSRLTLYTCTPLWLPKNRLVVIAELEKKL